jgi:hypothetical protein
MRDKPQDFADTQLSEVPHSTDPMLSAVYGPRFGATPPPLRVVASRQYPPKRNPAQPPAHHKGHPAPVQFPDPERLMHEREQRARAERGLDAEVFGQRQRQADGLRAACREAHDTGYRTGYVVGTRWGIWCGAIGGSLLGMIAGVCLVQLGMWWPL